MANMHGEIFIPIIGVGLRGYWARRDVCPECGGNLDTGWECNMCGYDAKPDAHPEKSPQ